MDPFSARVRTYQEQGGDDTVLTATADRWESVAQEVRELRSGTAEGGREMEGSKRKRLSERRQK